MPAFATLIALALLPAAAAAHVGDVLHVHAPELVALVVTAVVLAGLTRRRVTRQETPVRRRDTRR